MTSESVAPMVETETPRRRGRKPANTSAPPRHKKDARERFVRLAEARTNKAVKAIEVIGNLANRAVYPSTDDDAAQIIGELSAAVDKCKARFTNPETNKKRGFKLRS
jgi:hypothetical protein